MWLPGAGGRERDRPEVRQSFALLPPAKHCGGSERGAGAGPGLISSKARQYLCSWEGDRTLPTLMPREQGEEKGDGRVK